MLSFAERLSHVTHPLSQRLLQLMLQKQSNLAISADVADPEQCLQLIDAVGPHVCMVKTHVDILDTFTTNWLQRLQELQSKHDFLLFEDRKFADIGHTVQQQYAAGPFCIADWADITNAHALPGPGIVQALRAVGQPKGRGLLLLAQMSSAGNLLDASYMQATVEMAAADPEFVIGFVAQQAVAADPRWLVFTPGVQLAVASDALGQRYRTPEQAMAAGADVLIVGRGISQAADPAKMSAQYQAACWAAYEKCLSDADR